MVRPPISFWEEGMPLALSRLSVCRRSYRLQEEPSPLSKLEFLFM